MSGSRSGSGIEIVGESGNSNHSDGVSTSNSDNKNKPSYYDRLAFILDTTLSIQQQLNNLSTPSQEQSSFSTSTLGSSPITLDIEQSTLTPLKENEAQNPPAEIEETKYKARNKHADLLACTEAVINCYQEEHNKGSEIETIFAECRWHFALLLQACKTEIKEFKTDENLNYTLNNVRNSVLYSNIESSSIQSSPLIDNLNPASPRGMLTDENLTNDLVQVTELPIEGILNFPKRPFENTSAEIDFFAEVDKNFNQKKGEEKELKKGEEKELISYYHVLDIINTKAAIADKHNLRGKKRTQFYKTVDTYHNELKEHLVNMHSRVSRGKEDVVLPLSFQNPDVQYFNWTLVEKLEKAEQELNSGLRFYFNKYIRSDQGNNKINSDMNFIRSLKNQLKNVSEFTKSPESYMALLTEISQKLDSQSISTRTRPYLEEIKQSIYTRVFYYNQSSLRQAYDMFEKIEPKRKRTPYEDRIFNKIKGRLLQTQEKFYSRIPEENQIRAAWVGNKNLFKRLSLQLSVVNGGLLNRISSLFKRVYARDKVTNRDDFIKEINERIEKFGNLDINKINVRGEIVKYIAYLNKKLNKLRENKNNYDRPDEMISILNNHLSEYRKYITTENQRLFKFAEEEVDILKPEHSINKDEKNTIIARYDTEKQFEILEKLEKEKSKPAETTAVIDAEQILIKNEQLTSKFYGDLLNNLYNLFFSSKAIDGGYVQVKDSEMASDIKSIGDKLGKLVSFMPVGGNAAQSVANVMAGQIAAHVQNQAIRNHQGVSKQIPTVELFYYMAEYLARKLTQILEHQIQLISENDFSKLIKVIHQRVLKSMGKHIKEASLERSLQIAVIDVINSGQSHGYLGILPTYFEKKGTSGVLETLSNVFTVEGLLTKTGVVVEENGEYTFYTGTGRDPEKFGYRKGTKEEVETLRLTEVTDNKVELNTRYKETTKLNYEGLTTPYIPALNEGQILKEEIAKQQNKMAEQQNTIDDQAAQLVKQGQDIAAQQKTIDNQAAQLVQQQQKITEHQSMLTEVVTNANNKENVNNLRKIVKKLKKIESLQDDITYNKDRQKETENPREKETYQRIINKKTEKWQSLAEDLKRLGYDKPIEDKSTKVSDTVAQLVTGNQGSVTSFSIFKPENNPQMEQKTNEVNNNQEPASTSPVKRRGSQ